MFKESLAALDSYKTNDVIAANIKAEVAYIGGGDIVENKSAYLRKKRYKGERVYEGDRL